MSNEPTELDFEKALVELQQIVDQLEVGESSLEESLERYERGMKLVSHCNGLLDKAELRVKELLPDGQEGDFEGPLDARS